MDQQRTRDPVQLLTWLDEQYREDRQELVELRKLTASQSQTLEDLLKRFESLERRLSNAQSQLGKFDEIDEVLEELKRDVTSAIDERENRLRQRDNQLETRLNAHDPKLASLSKALEEVQGALGALEGRVEELPSRLQDHTKQTVGLARDIEELEQGFNQIQARLAQIGERLSGQSDSTAALAQRLENLNGRLSNTQGNLAQFGERLANQGDATANLGKQLERLEGRLTNVQGNLTQVGQRVANQGDSTSTLAKRLKHLEGRLSNTQAQLVKFPQIEAALQETRDEIVLMIKDIEEERKKEAREAAQIREAEIKDLRRAIDSIYPRLEPIPHLDERIKALVEEDDRLRKYVSEQEQKFPQLRESIQDHRARLSYLEEDQPKQIRRIDQLELQIPRLDKAIEETDSKIPFLEEWAQRSAEQIDELKRFEDQIARWRSTFIEEIRQGERHRDRRLTDWEKVLKEHAEVVTQWRETLRRYELSHQDSKRALGEVEELAQELERDQAEIAEQQRLADERLQRELHAWQQENEKRWRLFLKRRDYDWQQQDKRDVVQDRRLEHLEIWIEEHVERFVEEIERLDENDRQVLARIVSLVKYLNEIVEQQIAERKQQRDRLASETVPDDVLTTRSSPFKRRARNDWQQHEHQPEE